MRKLLALYDAFTDSMWSSVLVCVVGLLLFSIQLSPLTWNTEIWRFKRSASPFFLELNPWVSFGLFTVLFLLKGQLGNLVFTRKLFIPKKFSLTQFVKRLRPKFLLPLILSSYLQELLYRKIVLEICLSWEVPLYIGLVAHSCIFSLSHFLFGLLFGGASAGDFAPGYEIVDGLFDWFVSGMFYGQVYIWTGSILVPTLYHVYHNYIQVVMTNTPYRVILQLHPNGDKGYVLLQSAWGDYEHPLYDDQDWGEWLSLKQANRLAKKVSRYYGGLRVDTLSYDA